MFQTRTGVLQDVPALGQEKKYLTTRLGFRCLPAHSKLWVLLQRSAGAPQSGHLPWGTHAEVAGQRRTGSE